MSTKTSSYKEIAKKKLEHRNSKFKSEWILSADQLPSAEIADVSTWIEKSGVLSDAEKSITGSDAPTILEKVRTKKWSAYEVAKAFCRRASIAHQLTNCLSEVFFDEGLEQARELDEYLEKHGTVKGPLHGLPISLKDNLNVKGQATTVGIVNFAFNPEKFEEESVLVHMLRRMGAVFYVKTNVPVAMMMPESTNHIYGNTLNPLNRNLSAGGSSGGEAALLALKGSPIGVGSDIGGSIRIPASFQNLYALRPTFGRFPTFGSRSGLPGLESVNSVNGPLTTSLKSLETYCKTVIDGEPWNYDPRMIEIPWRKVDLPEKLTFAVCYDDGNVRPTPPIARGLKITVAALEAAGHEVIEWDPAEHLRLSQICTEFFVSDGGTHLNKHIHATGEPFFEYMKMYGTSPDIPVSELWSLHSERNQLIKKVLDKWMGTANKTKSGKPIDAIIIPNTPFAGNEHGKFHDYVGYTSPFNLLDYSAGVFPVTRADKNLDTPYESCNNYCKTDTAIWKDYDPEKVHGGAVALQLVCRKFEEEKVVEIMKVISKLIQYS